MTERDFKLFLIFIAVLFISLFSCIGYDIYKIENSPEDIGTYHNVTVVDKQYHWTGKFKVHYIYGDYYGNKFTLRVPSNDFDYYEIGDVINVEWDNKRNRYKSIKWIKHGGN